MASVKPTTDPYRVLGILRIADAEQVKAAHRRMAKRYHPDGSAGDEARFLAVQEAYQLLSDPLRRREWDRGHAPGPISSRPKRRARPERRRRRDSRAGTSGRVPWWVDFRPGAARPAEPRTAAPDDGPDEFDVFSRSSGAAWSAAARQHFRRGTDELPSRGVWRYRGTQVVTGAEARKVAAEEEEENSRR